MTDHRGRRPRSPSLLMPLMPLMPLMLLSLTGCVAIPPETPETVAAREPVLLQARVQHGRRFADPETVSWTGWGQLLLTPTTLYVTYSGGSFALSYAVIEEASRQSLRRLGLFAPGQPVDDLLVVRTARPTCGNGCVFELPDQAAGRALELIERQRLAVDPFGRLDGPRPVWLSTGLRGARAWWSQQPEYLNRTAPAQKAAVDEWFCARTGCRSQPRSAQVYGDAARLALLGERAGYRFQTLTGIAVDRRTELDTRALVAALETADERVNSLLVSDLSAITLRERISADYRLSVEASFRSFVDYFDLEPPKDGAYFIDSYVVEKPIDDWLRMSAAEFDELVAAAARQTAARVLASLAPRVGSGPAADGR